MNSASKQLEGSPLPGIGRGFVTVLLAASVGLFPLLAADSVRESNPATIEIGAVAKDGFAALEAADARIGELVAEGRLTEIELQVRIVRASVEAILLDIETTDQSLLKRVNSAAREVLSLAERLSTVARAGKRARAETVYHNLHRYVEFVQTHLPDALRRDGGQRHHHR